MYFRLALVWILALTIFPMIFQYHFVQNTASSQGPQLRDPNLRVELVFDGLEYPTSMAFLDEDDILVLEKDKGTVQRIVNGEVMEPPPLDVAVANENERGMLGIAISRLKAGSPTYVYLYFTESSSEEDGSDNCPKISYCEEGNTPKGNRLYKYEFIDNKLVNPDLLLDLPATPGSDHNGGALAVGKNNEIYLVVGDLSYSNSQASNVRDGRAVDGRGGILRIDQDGEIVRDGTYPILGNEHPLDMYYAYGIRNSFGIGIDPVSGKLWDTENGVDFGDEINLVEPGFNSGWVQIQGMASSSNISEVNSENGEDFVWDSLVDFGGKGNYSDPEFVWRLPVGLTSVKFLNSDRLGTPYKDDMFVADIHNGNIYRFDLDEQRRELILKGSLADKVLDNGEEDQDIIFASGFVGITDMEVGPDGNLYILSFHEKTKADRQHYYGQGALYRIVPANQDAS
jgi:glucose/arabinose dehydrogenase